MIAWNMRVWVVGVVLAAAGSAAAEESLEEQIVRLSADRRSLESYYGTGYSEADASRVRRFLQESSAAFREVDFDALDRAGKIDHILVRSHLTRELARVDKAVERVEEAADYLPFLDDVLSLLEARRSIERVEGRAMADLLVSIAEKIDAAQASVEIKVDGWGEAGVPQDARILAERSRQLAGTLRRDLRDWADFYRGYDPAVSWWIDAPAVAADRALESYAKFLRRKVLGVGDDDDDPVVGNPLGPEALERELAAEFVAYTPAELIEIGEREFAWCEAERVRAAQEMGLGDDWKAALERTKEGFVEPGQQPFLIKELVLEAIGYFKEHDLVTIPPLCEENWEMVMMTPERQKVNPYLTGGQTISVSYPTAGMEHAEKLMSLRGNNRHFSRAVVHHEIIPGHHLQLFMAERYRPYRRLFRTPFLVEGWALYWERRLWDMGFFQSPEDRTGALFWRSHRCARIIFSLKYHLGEMTEDEAIDFLVERVGHERRNATAEVRRSVGDGYPPLYQAAYMLGGLQIEALHQELVEAGQMGEKEFHDALLKENSIPIELIRAALSGEEPGADFAASWRFYPGM
ncbi:DUF885 family protein [soil metagenome]